ncbi:hypothetical protein ACFL4T_13055 [candidate division KSB1 bacterium]
MKRTRLITITLAVLFVLLYCDEKNVFEPRNYDITWEKTSCPLERIDHVFASPNGTLFAVTEEAMAWGGPAEMYRSSDDGETWEKLNWYLSIDDLVFKKNGDIFTKAYSEWSSHLLRSTNNGDIWEELSLASPGDRTFGPLTMDSNENIFAVANNAVYRSSDNGETWIKKGNALDHSCKLVVTNRGTIYLGSTFDVYYSKDAGLSWTKTNAPEDFEIRGLCLHPADMIFARTFNKLYYSSTRKFDWKRITEFDTWGLEGLMIDEEGVIYVLIEESFYSPGEEYGIFISQDHGKSFQKIEPPHEHMESFTLDPGGIMYIGTFDDGLYKSNEPFF